MLTKKQNELREDDNSLLAQKSADETQIKEKKTDSQPDASRSKKKHLTTIRIFTGNTGGKVPSDICVNMKFEEFVIKNYDEFKDRYKALHIEGELSIEYMSLFYAWGLLEVPYILESDESFEKYTRSLITDMNRRVRYGHESYSDVADIIKKIVVVNQTLKMHQYITAEF
jgi:hypothetical protein